MRQKGFTPLEIVKLSNGKKNNKSLTGFTLIEAVVSAGIFAFVISSIVAIYISAIRLDRKTRAERAVVQNARYIMDFLAKEVRSGRIDYAHPGYGGTADNPDQLHIINQAGDSESFTLACVLGVCKITMEKNGSPPADLTSDAVKITNLEFRVLPEVDPFLPPYVSNIQPSVTIILEVSSNTGGSTEDQAKVNLQSTFTERYYPSRP